MAEIETEGDWHWRNSMKPVRFFALDARVALFALLFIIHMRPWTLGLFCLVCILFWILERKGLTFDAAIRSFRTWLLGRERPGYLWIRRRRLHDYG
ncbi:MAG: IcmT/TraK family protein [Alphaproteobacteria bacterium]|nr:IcmT/TraK family protein [Alphaproteobacteria bacterium]